MVAVNRETLMIIYPLLLGISVYKWHKNGLVLRYLLHNPCLDR